MHPAEVISAAMKRAAANDSLVENDFTISLNFYNFRIFQSI